MVPDEDRYSRFLTQELVDRKLFWYEDWLQMEREFEVPNNELVGCDSNYMYD